jgi:hypothetical protein
VLVLLAACFSTGVASGQDSKGRSSSWDNLKSLTPAQEIRVVMKNHKSYQGGFESFSDDGITLRRAAGEQTLPSKDILRVSWKGQNHRARNAAIGAVVGAGAGLGIGLADYIAIRNQTICTPVLFGCVYSSNSHWGIILLTSVGALAGAVIGAAVPTGGWHTVYSAR